MDSGICKISSLPTFLEDKPSGQSSGLTHHCGSPGGGWFLFKGLTQSLPSIPTAQGASSHTADESHQKSFAKNPFVCNVIPFVLILVS